MNPKHLEEAFQYAKHSLELEGFKITKEDEMNMKAVFTGELTKQELIEQLKQR